MWFRNTLERTPRKVVKSSSLLGSIRRYLRDKFPNIFIEGNLDSLTEFKSHADHGLDWVERSLRPAIGDATILPPLFASAMYGANGSEFDEWRAVNHPGGGRSFQGVFIESRDLVAQCYRFSVREGMLDWHGTQLPESKAGVLVVDITLLNLITQSLSLLVAEFWTEPRESFANLVRYARIPGCEPPAPDEATELLSPDETQAAATAKTEFKELLCASAEADWPTGGASQASRFLADRGVSRDTQAKYYLYLQSMALHFLYAHEYGHYCYAWQDDPGTSSARAWADGALARLGADGEELREELFCDYIGVSNTLFQAQRFEVPSCIPFVVVAWSMLFIGAVLQGARSSPFTIRAAELMDLRFRSQLDTWIKMDDFIIYNNTEIFAQLTNDTLPKLSASTVNVLKL